MKTKILITGSSGFIGFHLSKKLLQKGKNFSKKEKKPTKKEKLY